MNFFIWHYNKFASLSCLVSFIRSWDRLRSSSECFANNGLAYVVNFSILIERFKDLDVKYNTQHFLFAKTLRIGLHVGVYQLKVEASVLRQDLKGVPKTFNSSIINSIIN